MTGKQLRKWRRKFDLTQLQLAKKIGYAKNSISYLERTDAIITPKMKRLLKTIGNKKATS
jgi:transcriptional regulator with XRE-family HTH domain